jgi:hypothetical protein
MSLETQFDWFQLFNEHHVLHCVFCDLVNLANLFFVLFSAIYNEWFVTTRSRSSLE